MDFRTARPSEPDFSYGDEHGCYTDDRDHCFGIRSPGLGVVFVSVDHASYEWFSDDDAHTSDSDADEC